MPEEYLLRKKSLFKMSTFLKMHKMMGNKKKITHRLNILSKGQLDISLSSHHLFKINNNNDDKTANMETVRLLQKHGCFPSAITAVMHVIIWSNVKVSSI